MYRQRPKYLRAERDAGSNPAIAIILNRITMSIRADKVEKIIEEHKEMWLELKDTYKDFWDARASYYNYLVNNGFMDPKEFHVFKMVLGRENYL